MPPRLGISDLHCKGNGTFSARNFDFTGYLPPLTRFRVIPGAQPTGAINVFDVSLPEQNYQNLLEFSGRGKLDRINIVAALGLYQSLHEYIVASLFYRGYSHPDNLFSVFFQNRILKFVISQLPGFPLIGKFRIFQNVFGFSSQGSNSCKGQYDCAKDADPMEILPIFLSFSF